MKASESEITESSFPRFLHIRDSGLFARPKFSRTGNSQRQEVGTERSLFLLNAAAHTMDIFFLREPHAERLRFPAARTWNDQKCGALLACSRSRRVSHVFSLEKKAASFAGNRIFHLVKMNCHVCLTDAYNEISVGTFQRGNVGNERRANPLTHFYAATFILYMVPPETFAFPLR